MLQFRAAWYPEHWPVQRWSEDIRLMVEAGMNVCRIGEFAWSTMEPSEGYYDFGWLESAVELLHNNGIAVVMGTPTAAPPAWLTHHHPDTLATEPGGRLAQHGNRCHYNPGSTTYLRYVRRIVDQMARRFGQDPRVIGWQIDNEYNRIDYSEDTGRRFQAFLKDQYGTLDRLNAAWSTAYWSQTYTDWREIPLPIGGHNPGLMLAFRHFATRVWRDFQKLQIDTIRQHALPSQWITHNFMGWFDGFDHYAVSKDLDLASWDWYVGTGHHSYTDTGLVHDLTRGFKRRNFWVMETQPGCVNWSVTNNMLNRGEARCMALHAVAHGADALLYWQWRSAPGGQEQLHGSLVGADGRPRPFYSEAQQIGADFKALSQSIADSKPVNKIAILHSYDSRWSIDAQRHNREFDPIELIRHFGRPLARRNYGIDVVSPEDALTGYSLIIAPGLTVLSEDAVASITAAVDKGALLVLGVRCGHKDSNNALFDTLQPGPLRETAGVEVEEYFALDVPVSVSATWGDTASTGHCRLWAERLRPISADVEIAATFDQSNGWLDGGSAVTISPANANGGRVVCVGAWLDDALQDSLISWLVSLAGVHPSFDRPVDGVEFAKRVRQDGSEVLFAINHTRETKSFNLLPGDPMHDVLNGVMHQGTVTLPPYGASVLARQG